MTPAPRHIARLLYRHLNGTISEPEMAELQDWLTASDDHRRFADELSGDLTVGKLVVQELADEEQRVEEALLQRAKSQLVFAEPSSQPAIHRVHFLRRWWWAAASIIVLLGAGTYLWFTTQNKPSGVAIVRPGATEKDIAPGHNGAILTLADDTQVVLDSLGNGVIATQNGAQVVLEDGQLAYDPTGRSTDNIVFNTMTTPKGRQFQVTLPDGTKVWLNAASSIKYPTVFAANERIVEVDGEAYLEVAKNPKQPFKVKVRDGTTIEVLGTHFNINAYVDEANIRTTLLEGSVKVANGADEALLQPGQQAEIKDKGKIQVIKDANIEKVMAWKNGLFNFEGVKLEEVMRQLSRWYNIEVVYAKGVPDIKIGGEMSRNVMLSDLIKGLQELEVNFRLEEGNRRLVVLP